MEADKVEQRQKYWSELTADEKADRMREEVKRLQRQLEEAREQIRLLLRHGHNGSDIVVPLQKPYEPEENLPRLRGFNRQETDPAECYF